MPQSAASAFWKRCPICCKCFCYGISVCFLKYQGFFQVSYINEIDIVNKNEILKNRVFYQIFVDRFNKSLDNNNPRININWGEMVKQKTIAGGNLKGIVEKINYLKTTTFGGYW